MKYFIDTEFIEDGHTIDLISIGVVAEDGRELSRQSSEFDPRKASQWVKDNVFPHLALCPYVLVIPPYTAQALRTTLAQHQQGQCVDQQRGWLYNCPWRTRTQLKRDILSFMDPAVYGTPELWGYYSAYDHIAFCQLFGTMMDLPEGFPMRTLDLEQWRFHLGNPELPKQEGTEHNALADARWNKHAWEYLASFARRSQDETRAQ